MARIVALFAVFALATAAAPFSNFTAQAKKANDHYVQKDYAAADITYEAAVASFISTFGENHLLTKGVKERHSIVKVLNNKPARTDLDANYPYTSNRSMHTIQLDRCSDGEQNGNETGVDCGGPDCVDCGGVDCVYSETACTCTPACGNTCDCTDNITITTPAAGRGQACPGGTNRNFTGAACPTDCHKDPYTGTIHSNGHGNYCTSTCKCQHGEGDCDGDSECADGTKCVHNVGATYGWSSGTDVCETVPTPVPGGCSDNALSSVVVCASTGAYACEGIWTQPGMEAGAAQLCNAGYSLCNYAKMNAMSVSGQTACKEMKDGFFGAKVSSNGSHRCNKDGTVGTDDVWGCGDTCSNSGATCGSALKCAFGHEKCNGGWSCNGGNTEFSTLIHTDNMLNKGGVMCCANSF